MCLIIEVALVDVNPLNLLALALLNGLELFGLMSLIVYCVEGVGIPPPLLPQLHFGPGFYEI